MLYTLLRAGLWGERPEDLSAFPLSRKTWMQLLRTARQQTVTGIVYHGITLLPEEMMPPQEVMIQWVAEVDRIEQNNRRMNEALQELLQQYSAIEVHPIVLKGQGVAAMYDTPHLRECGDIDLYFTNEEEGDRALKMLEEKGIAYEQHADKSICYSWKGIAIEHHTELIDLHSPKNRRWVKGYIKEQGYTTMTLNKQTEITVPCPQLYLLMLNMHILKHALGVGIGLRQLCDMARAYKYLEGKIEFSSMRDISQTTGLQRWNELLHAFIVKHLGLPQQLQPYEELKHIDTTPLQHIIEEGGNFGQHADNKGEHSRLKTAHCFWKRRGFAWRYARTEAMWMVVRLTVNG